MSFEKLISDIETYLPMASKSNTKVSERGVDWHLDHILKVVNSICVAVQNSDPEEFNPKFNIYKNLILFSGYMPRGKGRSPKSFNNLDPINLEEIIEQFLKAKTNLAGLDKLSKNHHFKHPIFGHLNLIQTKRFIKIHSHHHLKIIRDILK